MDEQFVWMTTRRIQPGTLTDFERAWRPDTHPEGMLRAYAYWSELRTSSKSSGSRFGPQRSRAKRGGPPNRRRADVRRWLPTSLMNRKRSTGAAS